MCRVAGCDHRLLCLTQCLRAPLALEQELIVIHHQHLHLGIGHLPEGDRSRPRRCEHQRGEAGTALALLHLRNTAPPMQNSRNRRWPPKAWWRPYLIAREALERIAELYAIESLLGGQSAEQGLDIRQAESKIRQVSF
jgi:hypothetical protein